MGRKEDAVAPDAAVDAERLQRNSTLLVARCEREDGSVVPIRIRNISASGLKGESRDVVDFDLDEPIKLRFPNLSPITAQVVRYARGEIGIRFNRKIDLEQLTAVRATASPIPQSPRSEAVSKWIDLNERLRQNKQMVPPRAV